MPIKQVTPIQAIQDYLMLSLERRQKAILYNLNYVGEQCINHARSTDSYKDQTGNLRSSIGYVLVEDGNIIQQSDFKQEPPKAEKQIGHTYDGGKTGEQFAREIAEEHRAGICLIVVAGMNYASYVAAKGYDVLDSAETMAEWLVPKLIKQLGYGLDEIDW